MSERYGIVNGWFVEYVNHHTCGIARGGYYGHPEPGCGMEPLCRAEQMTDADRALLAGAPVSSSVVPERHNHE